MARVVILLGVQISVQSVHESSPESRFYMDPCTPRLAPIDILVLHVSNKLDHVACTMYLLQ